MTIMRGYFMSQARAGQKYKEKRHNGKSVAVHRIKAEAVLGKPLPSKCVVHHFNGSTDSGPLIVCEDQTYHYLLHVRKRAFDATGDAHKKWCTYCKTWDVTTNMVRMKSGQKGERFYHKKCIDENTTKINARVMALKRTSTL
jgi:hypothetical protein